MEDFVAFDSPSPDGSASTAARCAATPASAISVGDINLGSGSDSGTTPASVAGSITAFESTQHAASAQSSFARRYAAAHSSCVIAEHAAAAHFAATCINAGGLCT